MDPWSQPPGGLTRRQRLDRRRRRLQRAIAGVAVLAVALTGARTALVRSEPVSATSALRAYRSAVERSQAPLAGSRVPGGDRARREPTPGKPRTSTKEAGAPQDADLDGAAIRQTRQASLPDRRPPRPEPSSPPQSERTRPLDGVYPWEVEGYEETSGGTRRELPARSNRIITYRDRGAWTEHHIFSSERESWFHLDRSDAGTVTDAVRNRVQFGPVEVDRTVAFDPPVLGTRLPLRLQDSWSGAWKGRTEGEYRARVFEHTYLTIEGERVEVWGVEVAMQMRGEVEGQVLTRSWLAPAHALIVKQYQKMSVESGPGGYEMEWMGRVASLTPAR